jgi:glucosamine kinase
MQKTLLVAECGSTKCDWRVVTSNGRIIALETNGFNPNYMEPDVLSKAIQLNEDLQLIAKEVSEIYFFGSGCNTLKNKQVVIDLLNKYFSNSIINVHSDLLAACNAFYKGEPIICSILGTGSNACLFDGENMSFCAPSLGYVLGDDGSGNKIGQQLLRDYYFHQMPEHLKVIFKSKYALEVDALIHTLYQAPRPNTFLASFARFAVENKEDKYIQQLVKKEFDDFLKIFVCGFENYKALKVGFVGSIAWYFQNSLLESCETLEIEVAGILQKPIDALAQFYLAKLKIQ